MNNFGNFTSESYNVCQIDKPVNYKPYAFDGYQSCYKYLFSLWFKQNYMDHVNVAEIVQQNIRVTYRVSPKLCYWRSVELI